MHTKRFIGLLLAFVVLIACMTVGMAQDDNDFQIDLDGHKSWTLTYGFGNALGLATSSTAPGKISLDQTLSVDVRGEALSVLSLEIHYDDTLPESMQSFALYLDTEHLDGVAGDFTLTGVNDFTAYNKKMKGVKLEYAFGDSLLTAVASRSEGISQTQIFVGQKASAQTSYSRYASVESQLPAAYKKNLEGLYAFPLDALYTEEFSTVTFHLPATPAVKAALSQYNLSFLSDTLAAAEAAVLKAQDFRVVDHDGQVLLLSRDAVSLLRERIRAAITQYNADHGLTGSSAAKYPFASGTTYELEFLNLLLPSAVVAVDDDTYTVGDAVRRRFYSLGQTDVDAATVVVRVSTDGTHFEDLASGRLQGFSYEVIAEAGILVCDFPASFFASTSAIQVEFSYAVSGGSYALGLSLVPYSERVLLNDVPLVRDVDYVIQYDVGILFLLDEIEDDDVLRIDYELYSGGFGQATDYASYFFGLILDMPLSEAVDIRAQLLQLAEDPFSTADRESVSTMPNRHTIAGLTADISLDGFSANVRIGFNHDRFPFDDNARDQKPNVVSSIAADGGLVLFGHRAGLTVNQYGEWSSYATASGLASRIVYDVLMFDDRAWIATAAGLNVVELEGAAPFDLLTNWSQYGADQGVGDDAATALAVLDDQLWIGTDIGIVSVSPDELDDLEAWTRFSADVYPGISAVTCLAADGEWLVVGTSHGAYRFDPADGTAALLDGSEGLEIYDVFVRNGTVYVGSSRGLRSYRNGVGTGWLVLGSAVYTVASYDGELVYGTDAGLRNPSSGESLVDDGPVTALASDGFGLWIGTQASEEGASDIYYLDEIPTAFPSSVTGLPERDPAGYLDTDAAEHTAEGWVGRASFSRETRRYTLTGTVETYPPTFRPIGSYHRSDLSGWSLAGTYTLSRDAEIEASHTYRIDDLAEGDPSTRIDNRIALRWSSGLRGVLDVQHGSETLGSSQDSEHTTDLSYRLALSDSFFDERLDLDLSWSDSTSDSNLRDDAIENNRLSLAATTQWTDALTTRTSWQRSIRWTGSTRNGNEGIDLSADWGRSWDWISLTAEHDTTWARSLDEKIGEWTHASVFGAEIETVDLGSLQLTPDADFSWELDRGTTDLDAELGLKIGVGGFTIRNRLSGGLRNLGEPVFHENAELSVQVRYAGIESLDTSVSYKGTIDTAVLKQQRRTTLGHSLTGRLLWDPEAGTPHDELTFSLRTKQTGGVLSSISATLENSFTMSLSGLFVREKTAETDPDPDAEDAQGEPPYPLADLQVDSSVAYRLADGDPDASLTTTGSLSVQLSPSWSVIGSITGVVGYRPATALYASGLLQVTVAIDF